MYRWDKEHSPYFLFHGETALYKILTIQGETANFSQKFQVEIQAFPGENMELYKQNRKISGRNTGISWRKWKVSWRIFPLFLPEKKTVDHGESKQWGFFFTCTVCVLLTFSNVFSSLKLLGWLKPNFIWSLLVTGERKLFKWSRSHDQAGRHAHI